MFGRSALAVELELARDDVFRWRDADLDPADGVAARVSQRPGVELVAPGQVDVCSQPGGAMDDVEVSVAFATALLEEDLRRWDVELVGWEDRRERFAMLR